MASFSIAGKDFNPDEFLKKTKLKVDKIVYKGQHRHNMPSAKIMEYSFIVINIPQTSGQNDWNEQIEGTINFLEKNREEISIAKNIKGLEDIGIDLILTTPKIWEGYLGSIYFPPKLLQICGEMSLSIEVSILESE